MKARCLVLLVLLALAALSLGAQAQKPAALKWQTIDITGADSTSAMQINNRGEIAGDYTIGATDHGFILRNGVVETIDHPNASLSVTFMTGISNSGAAVGSYTTDEMIGCGADCVMPKFNGFKWKDGAFEAVDVPGADYTLPHGNNERGEIVGEYMKDGKCYGFVTAKNGIIPLDLSDSPDWNGWSSPIDINASGDMAGWYGDGNTWVFHGFLYKNGRRVTIDVPGSTWTMARGINASGDVVGAASDLGVGFVWSHGVLTVIQIPDAMWTFCSGINDRGDIVGQYGDADGKTHGFVIYK